MSREKLESNDPAEENKTGRQALFRELITLGQKIRTLETELKKGAPLLNLEK
ncbi:hypothetical protein KKG41_06730 [Patescibacteria group bacterium]|nr:hypothetical protein [Patescibacteria group bacterium]MBU1890140.1 hypothetical protein [Patescibacteria group bacterium]